MRDKVRWGIAGTGTIANSLASDFRFATHASLVAVSSRNAQKAESFAGRFGGIRGYQGIEALAASPDIDAIYVASPNAEHLQQATLALAAGKAVLVEKPLTASSADARTLANAAAAGSTFAMEALWTCFLPAISRGRELLTAGTLGAIRHVRADLAYEKPFDAGSRFFDPVLGGGSMLDLGIYPIALCLNLFGHPGSVDGTWKRAPTGVDSSAKIKLAYDGFDAELGCGFDRNGHNRFVIEGERGTLVIDTPFLKASRLFVSTGGAARKLLAFNGKTAYRLARHIPLPGLTRHDHHFPGSGLQFEIEAASAAILEGRSEHPLMPLSASIKALEIIETVRSRTPEAG